MELLIDSSDVSKINKLIDLYPIDGVTTNPTIIAKERKPFLSLMKELEEIVGDKMFHVQILSVTCTDMVKEAFYLNENLNGNVFIKVPVIPEGIKAIKLLQKEGIKTTATAVITPQQALMAAKAGANYVAPYVNRVSNLSVDGVQVVRDIVRLLKTYELPTKVVGASFKNVDQINQISLSGTHAITASPEMIEAMQDHLLTDWSVQQFSSDWKKVYGVDHIREANDSL